MMSTIVVEADFIPVRGFGGLPFPFNLQQTTDAIGYLYACGPEIWDIDRRGLRGHAGATVAYTISAKVAQLMLDFAEHQIFQRDPFQYSGWDSNIGYWLKERGVESYMPYRQYGEHEGRPNPEHRNAGLRSHHRADVLYGRLAFLPDDSRTKMLKHLVSRAEARLWGLGRLTTGRLLRWHDFQRSKDKAKMLRVVIGRQLFSKPPSFLNFTR